MHLRGPGGSAGVGGCFVDVHAAVAAERVDTAGGVGFDDADGQVLANAAGKLDLDGVRLADVADG